MQLWQDTQLIVWNQARIYRKFSPKVWHYVLYGEILRISTPSHEIEKFIFNKQDFPKKTDMFDSGRINIV